MPSLSASGLAGALIGFALGLVEYFIAISMVRSFVGREIDTARKENETLPGLALLDGNMRLLRITLIIAAATIYPAIGFVVGTMIAS